MCDHQALLLTIALAEVGVLKVFLLCSSPW